MLIRKVLLWGMQFLRQKEMKQINGINLLNLRVLATALKSWQWFLLIPEPKCSVLSSRLHSYTSP